MVIKKPYAFLIKNFKIIHAIIFILLGYLTLKTFNIYSFYNTYATHHYFVNSADLSSSYIDYFMFIAIILAIALTLVVYYLLRIKNKERKYYIAICIFYPILFVFYIILLGFFQDLQYSTLDFETVRILRDLTLIIVIPQVILTIIALSRALGFNIKQFEFKKDLQELEIDATDYEEVEITLGKNNYKYKRLFRKSLRHLRYFMLENKFLVTIVGSLCTLVVTLVTFVNLKVYNVNYSQNEKVLANSLWYSAGESYITSKNLNGSQINKDKYYLLIDVEISNSISYNVALDRNTFRLKVGNKLLFPKFNLSNMFLDIGTTFAPMEIESGTNKNNLIVFEIDKEDLKSEYMLRIKNTDNITIGQINTAYKDIIIKPSELDKVTDTGQFSIPVDLDFKDTLLENTLLQLESYNVSSSFQENYQYCEKEKCYNGKYLISPNSLGRGESTILKISSKLSLSDKVEEKSYISSAADFYTYYATLSYRTEGVTKQIKLSAVNVKYGKDSNAYFEVPKNVEKANKMELILNVRGIKYTITLK